MSKIYYTPSEVREMLGVSTATVYQMLEANLIPAFRLKTRWKIPKEQFEEWVRSQAVISTDSEK